MRELAAVVRRQHGVFTRRQAIEAGLSASSLERAARRGRYVRVYPSVYIEPAVPVSEEQTALAACLACGDGSAVSHSSVARLWKVETPQPARPEITVPPGRQPRLESVAVHRTRYLGRLDRAFMGCIPVTTPMRTLCDIAGRCDETSLEIALDTLWRRRLVEPARLAEYLRQRWCLNRPGADVLRRLAFARLDLDAPDSVLETLFYALMTSARLPLPVRHHEVRVASRKRYIDYAYPDAKLAIELDGYEPHLSSRSVFDDDRLRQNEIEALGWSFRRFTRTHLMEEKLMVQTTMGDALRLVPVRWRPRRR